MQQKQRIRGTTVEIDERAVELRRDMTAAELLLWGELRNKKLLGCKFRVQHPLGRFILDFCCPSRRLVVELDGKSHEDRREQDAERTQVLEAHGYKVLRFENEQVLQQLEFVLERIEQELEVSLERRPPWREGGPP